MTMWSYRIIAAPAFPSVDALQLVENPPDMQQATLFIPPALLGSYASYPYLPVQAVPQGMTNPDLIADVCDNGGELLTTLHFCAIWQRVSHDNGPWKWERVSFMTPSHLEHYYQVNNGNRFDVCPSCCRLHPSYLSCPLLEPTTLDNALAISSLALAVHAGNVYLVSCNPSVSGGNIIWHAITRVNGLQTCDNYGFVDLEVGKRFLIERKLPLGTGWIAVDEPPQLLFS